MMNKKSLSLVLDVDGVMTTGQFIYSVDGKCFKVFGPHDADGLKLIKNNISIEFITADKRGFEISKKRIVEDMGYPLTLVSEAERFDYLSNKYGLDKLIYIGDGYYDAKILEACFCGITPANARVEARKAANFITDSKSGEGAVMDACLYIKEKYLDNV